MPDCIHHWIITELETRYTRVDRHGQRIRGDMVERTLMKCKHCGEERPNTVVLPPEWDF